MRYSVLTLDEKMPSEPKFVSTTGKPSIQRIASRNFPFNCEEKLTKLEDELNNLLIRLKAQFALFCNNQSLALNDTKHLP